MSVYSNQHIQSLHYRVVVEMEGGGSAGKGVLQPLQHIFQQQQGCEGKANLSTHMKGKTVLYRLSCSPADGSQGNGESRGRKTHASPASAWWFPTVSRKTDGTMSVAIGASEGFGAQISCDDLVCGKFEFHRGQIESVLKNAVLVTVNTEHETVEMAMAALWVLLEGDERDDEDEMRALAEDERDERDGIWALQDDLTAMSVVSNNNSSVVQKDPLLVNQLVHDLTELLGDKLNHTPTLLIFKNHISRYQVALMQACSMNKQVDEMETLKQVEVTSMVDVLLQGLDKKEMLDKEVLQQLQRHLIAEVNTHTSVHTLHTHCTNLLRYTPYIPLY